MGNTTAPVKTGPKKDTKVVDEQTVMSWFKDSPKHSFEDVSGMSELKARLRSCVADTKLSGIRKYLKNIVESENMAWSEVRHCENRTVNTVLTVYERRAKENGISVKISANASHDLEVLPQDLVIIIANLFENAIHAAEKLESKDKYIEISIKESVQRLLIKIENTCRHDMAFDESLYGVGIHSVIAATNKYDGMYDFVVEDGVFAAKISLNLK
jgi:hypothetical protein